MSIDQVEELVRRLPRVTGCRIHVDDEGHPVAVMVTAAADSNPQEVRADVITVLGARARLDVLEEQIHVAVLAEAAAERDQPEDVVEPVEELSEPVNELVVEEIEAEGRLRLLSFATRVGEERTLAEAELAHGTRVALGRAESRGAGEAPELLASACLDAVEKLSHGRAVLRVVAYQRTTVGSQDVVCVLVQEANGRDERHLVGAARVTGDVGRALAYAALDGVNRRIGSIFAAPPSDYEID